MAACTGAGIVSPEDWGRSRLGVVIDARIRLLVDVTLLFLEIIPAELVTEVC